MQHAIDVTAAEEDVPTSLSQLSQAAFPRYLWPLMPNCQQGFDHYVRMGTTSNSLRWARQFSIAHSFDSPVGYAEWRTKESVQFLNHICTHPSAQGRGVARALINHRISDLAPTTAIELDVFSSEPAFAFYKMLGFETISTHHWLLRAVPPTNDRQLEPLLSETTAHFKSEMRHFGFSRIEALWRGSPLTLSLPSPTLARLSAVRDFQDDDLLSAVSSAIPTVRQFAVIQPSNETVPGTEWTIPSSRLRANARTIQNQTQGLADPNIKQGP